MGTLFHTSGCWDPRFPACKAEIEVERPTSGSSSPRCRSGAGRSCSPTNNSLSLEGSDSLAKKN